MYRIDNITYKNGEDRTDGRYPLRKGCIGDILYLHIGEKMVFDYDKDNEGNDKSGYMHTSVVEDYEDTGNGFIVFTENSIFYFTRLEEEI